MPKRSRSIHRLRRTAALTPYNNVLSFVAVLIPEHSVGEFLAITRGAAIIHVQDGVAMRCVDLVLDIECGTVLTMRTAVNVHDESMFRCGGHAQRLSEKRFDFEFVVVAEEGEGFDFGDLFSTEELRIQVGELARCAVSGFEIELGGIPRRGKAVGQRAVLAERPTSD